MVYSGTKRESRHQLRVRSVADLILLDLLVLLLAFAIFLFPSNVVRIILGIPVVFLFPGYALIAALYPRKEGMELVQRLALSLGLSIAIVSLIGLALNYTSWGIAVESTLPSITAFILVMSVVAWLRRRRSPSLERSDGESGPRILGWRGSTWDKCLSVLLVMSVMGTLAMASYAITKPKAGQRFTEFYVLGVDDTASNYPKELVVGQESEVTVGIVNQEHERVVYRLVVALNDIADGDVGPIVLEHNEKWEQPVLFTPQRSGVNQKLEFLLYKGDNAEPYLDPLRLRIQVAE